MLSTPYSLAADFYIDPINGHPDNNGSSESPWKSLQTVLNRGLIETQQWDTRPYDDNSSLVVKNEGAPIKSGDTIWLRDGEYGKVTIASHYNSDWVRIAAEPNHTPKFDSLIIRSASNWKVSGLHIESERTKENKLRSLVLINNNNWHGPVYDIQLNNNTIASTLDSKNWSKEDWNNKAAIGIFSQANNLYLNNNTMLNVVHGIYSSGENALIENNSIINFSGDGIRGLGNNSTYQYNLIKNAYKVNNNHDDGFQSWSYTKEDGVGSGSVKNVTLRGNTIINYDDSNQPHKGTLQGIGCFDGKYENWTIENNLIITDSWNGIGLYGVLDSKIVNNTVVDIDSEANGIPKIRVEKHKNGAESTGNLVRNNLTQSKILIDINQNTQDHNLIVEDPASTFVDPENLNFQLAEESEAIDTGSDEQTPNIDILQNERPQGGATDMGAYEYIPTTQSNSGNGLFF